LEGGKGKRDVRKVVKTGGRGPPAIQTKVRIGERRLLRRREKFGKKKRQCEKPNAGVPGRVFSTAFTTYVKTKPGDDVV